MDQETEVELQEQIRDLLSSGMRSTRSAEDRDFASAIELAEDAHFAMRALLGLIADHGAESGGGEMVRGVRRNDMACLFGLVNARLGEAVKRAHEAKDGRRQTGKNKESKPSPRKLRAVESAAVARP